MSPDSGGDDSTQGQTPFACKVALTATSGQSVRGGSDDGEQSTDSGDTELSANSFGLDSDDLEAAADELAADDLAQEVAEQWDTPEGEWWPCP